MSGRCLRFFCLCGAWWATLCAGSQVVVAQDDDATQRLELIQKVRELEEGGRLQVPADARQQQVLVVPKAAYLGKNYYGVLGGTWFLVAHVSVANLTDRPQVVRSEQFTLQTNTKRIVCEKLPDTVLNQMVHIDGRAWQLRSIQPTAEFKLSPGAVADTWLSFLGLPDEGVAQRLDVELAGEGRTAQADFVQHFARELRLDVTRIGPRRGLALLTIAGELNTLSARTLVRELERIAGVGVRRVVIRWTDEARQLETGLHNWLVQSATQLGRGETRPMTIYPQIPPRLTEMHLAAVPGSKQGVFPMRGAITGREHATAEGAVSAALKSAYERIPLAELIADIETGHPLTRVAAIAGGGSRLPASRLPLLIELADSDDREAQRAALQALGHFSDSQAIETLLRHIDHTEPPLAATAIRSLANSRFPEARDALHQALVGAEEERQLTIVKILAEEQRAVWGDVIYEYAGDPDSPIVADAMRALSHIGHPRLATLLGRVLREGNRQSHAEAFALLCLRPDSESEQIAMTYTLERLAEGPPSQQMLTLLERTGDRRAVPLLLRHLEGSRSIGRDKILTTLARIGGESIGPVFLERYEDLQDREKVIVLATLKALRSPEYRKLAGAALMSHSTTLVRAAIQGLQEDGSPDAVRLMERALDESPRSNTWSAVATGLTSIGTPDARAVLHRLSNSSNSEKRVAAGRAFANIERRSPAYSKMAEARVLSRKGDYAGAEEKLTEAITRDPDLPEIRVRRARARLALHKHKEALGDFEDALEIDPLSAKALTGRALVLVLTGRTEEAVQQTEQIRNQFRYDSSFAYYTACVYGRAIQVALATDPQADVGDYRRRGARDLEAAVHLGFNDLEMLKAETHLKSLEETEAYRKVLAELERKQGGTRGGAAIELR